MSISGNTHLYCVIGSPITHSLSPFIMNRAFAENEIDAAYTAADVPLERAGDAVAGLRALGFRGANVTYPLKTAVLARVDSASDAAAAIGAVNTLDLRDGRAMGHNTDARGAARALQVLGGVSPAGRTVLVIGGGGAARAAAYGLLEAGAERIVFAVRDTARVAPPVGRLRIAFPKSGIDIRTMNDMRAEEFDIVVNATPVGMNDAGVEQLVDEASVTPSQCYFDFVYHPRRTPFLDTARRLGARTVDGLALLVAQAEEAFHIWTGFHFSLPDMYEAVAGSHEGNPLETRE